VRCQRQAPAAFYPRERPCTHSTGGWVGPRAGLDRCGKSLPHRDSIPGPSSPKPVAIPTELPGPREDILPSCVNIQTQTHSSTKLYYRQNCITYMKSLRVLDRKKAILNETNTKYMEESNIFFFKIRCFCWTNFGTILWVEDELKLCIYS
jgi:hypothetical protein